MDCPNCRSQVLDTWHFCPQCGLPSPSASPSPDSPSRTATRVSPGQLLENLPAAFLFITHRRRIGQVNATARTLFGIDKHRDPLGKPFEEFIRHPECVKIITRLLEEGAHPTTDGDEAIKSDEFSIQDAKDQETIYQISSSHIRNTANMRIGTAFIFQDITTLYKAEQMKKDIVAGLSHELRHPLTPMKGFIRALLDDEYEQQLTVEDRREFYTIIEENLDRLSRLIWNLVEASRIERLGSAAITFTWDTVELRTVTEEVLSRYRKCSPKHTFVIDFEPEEIDFESDADKIGSILSNFVSNAIKYSPEGSEIRIIARVKTADDAFPLGSVMLGVKDQGQGIDLRHAPKLGHVYGLRFSERRNMSGGRVGLYLVKNVIAAHKGTMKVESEVGKGSTFWAHLPCQQLDATQPA